MTLKQFQILKMVIAVIIAIVFSQSLIYRNFFIPIITLAIAMLVIFYAKKHVCGVLADERDYQVGGKSALLSIQIFSTIAVFITFFLYAFKDSNQFFEPVAMTLSFSVMALMFIHSLIFSYIGRFKFGEKRFFYLSLIAILIATIFLVGMRFLSGEDNWICKNGEWVKHGNPSYPAPQTICK
jgi:uncharacterized membrane protein